MFDIYIDFECIDIVRDSVSAVKFICRILQPVLIRNLHVCHISTANISLLLYVRGDVHYNGLLRTLIYDVTAMSFRLCPSVNHVS
jgi:hypothetical protein